MKFLPTFLFSIIEVYDPLIRNLSLGFGLARTNFFSSFKVGLTRSKYANSYG